MSQRDPILNQETLKAALEATPECLPTERLENMTADQVKNHPHVSNCMHCRTEIALLRTYESDTPLEDEGAAVAWIRARLESQREQAKAKPSKFAGRGSWWGRLLDRRTMWIAVPLAAAAIIGVASFVTLRPGKAPELRADAGSGPAIYRSQQVELESRSGELPAPPALLRWKAFPGAAQYNVTIMEVDREPLWSSQTSATSVSVPVKTRDKMLPGKTVLWQVTALDAQGKILATSQAERMVVRRPWHPNKTNLR